MTSQSVRGPLSVTWGAFRRSPQPKGRLLLIELRNRTGAVLTAFMLLGATAPMADNPAVPSAVIDHPAAPRGIYHYTKAYKPFTDAHHYIDESSRIVMTKQNEIQSNGYHVDLRAFHEDYVWRGEFFCQPDTVIVSPSAAGQRSWYLTGLVWTDDAWFTPDQVQISAAHYPRFGDLGDLTPEGKGNTAPMPFAVVETHNHFRGTHHVSTTVEITNQSATPAQAIYIYQDAAYLWFPRGTQKGTEPVNITLVDGEVASSIGTYRAREVGSNEALFSGYVDRKNGVISGVFTDLPGARIGTIGRYLGIRQTDGDGSGNKFHVLSGDVSSMEDVPGDNFPPSDHERSLKNRFVAIDFGVLAAGDTVRGKFERIMFYEPAGNLTDDTIVTLISDEMKRIVSTATGAL